MKKIKKFNKTVTRRKVRTRSRIKGTVSRPRLSVFRSNRYTAVQLIDDEGRKTLASVSTRELKKSSLKKTEAAKKIGEMIAEKAKTLGVTAAVFDRGAYRFHGRTKAVAEGAREKGLKI